MDADSAVDRAGARLVPFPSPQAWEAGAVAPGRFEVVDRVGPAQAGDVAGRQQAQAVVALLALVEQERPVAAQAQE